MKHHQLRAIGHNFADSMASGLCFVIGHYAVDVFGEAARNETRSLTVDFLAGDVTEGEASEDLRRAAGLFRDALPAFCATHGATVDQFRQLSVCFSMALGRPRFAVTVTDAAGRRSTTDYSGSPGRRPRVSDGRGGRRRKPVVMGREAAGE